MADNTAIEWTDATWNPVTGCSIVSPGCTNCYAMRLAGTRLKHTPSRVGLTVDSKAGPVWNGQVRLNEGWLDQPLHWKSPRRIFVCAHGDLFAENVPDEWVDRVFAVMALSPQHTFQVLTKRAGRMREYISGWTCDGARRLNIAAAAGRLMEDGDNAHDEVANAPWPLPNVWLGVSAERQQEADDRIPNLLETAAAIRFVSAEPLLGPIDLTSIDVDGAAEVLPLGAGWLGRGDEEDEEGMKASEMPRLDWIIVGGESGNGARPMHPAWARSIRDQCADAGVPFFFKQWGEWAPGESANFAPTRSERTATLWSDEWDKPEWKFGTLTPKASEEMHRDDEPDLYRFGKKRAGRLLDGVEHNGFPETNHG